MKKLKKWLLEKYLPAWCREQLLGDNEELMKALADARRENERLLAYISGMQSVLKQQKRQSVTVYGNKGAEK